MALLRSCHDALWSCCVWPTLLLPTTSATVVISLTTRVDRLGASASAAVLLLVELVYVGLHFKPLEPLLPGSSGVADRGFLHAYTSAAFFSSELALLLLQSSTRLCRIVEKCKRWLVKSRRAESRSVLSRDRGRL